MKPLKLEATFYTSYGFGQKGYSSYQFLKEAYDPKKVKNYCP